MVVHYGGGCVFLTLIKPFKNIKNKGYNASRGGCVEGRKMVFEAAHNSMRVTPMRDFNKW